MLNARDSLIILIFVGLAGFVLYKKLSPTAVQQLPPVVSVSPKQTAEKVPTKEKVPSNEKISDTRPQQREPEVPAADSAVEIGSLDEVACQKLLLSKDQVVVSRKKLDEIYNKIATLQAQINTLRERQEWRVQSFLERSENNKKIREEKVKFAELRDAVEKLRLQGERNEIFKLSQMVKQCLDKK